jgi:hypothetical protein
MRAVVILVVDSSGLQWRFFFLLRTERISVATCLVYKQRKNEI